MKRRADRRSGPRRTRPPRAGVTRDGVFVVDAEHVPQPAWRLDADLQLTGLIDGRRHAVHLPLTHAHQAGRAAAVEVDLAMIGPLCQGLRALVEDMTGAGEAILGPHAGEIGGLDAILDLDALPAVALLAHRLAGIADLLRPCLPPDYRIGPHCTCGRAVWPCPATQAAWIARGREPGIEVALVHQADAEDAAFEQIADQLRGDGLGDPHVGDNLDGDPGDPGDPGGDAG